MKAIDITRRYSGLKSQRTTIEGGWRFVDVYVSPYRNAGDQTDQYTEHQIQPIHRQHFDSTAVYSAKTLKSHIHGMLVSPATKWFNVTYRDEALSDDHAAKLWLEGTEEKVYQAIVQSKFGIMSAEFLYDMVCYGIGFGLEESRINSDEWGGLEFTSISVRDAYFETDHLGELNRFYRRLMWTPLEIYTKFGEDTPKDIVAQLESNADIDTKHEIVFCVYQREKYSDSPAAVPAKNRKYGAKYVRISDGSEIGEEGGYYEMPFFYAVWDSTSDSKYGNSPAMTAMADIETVNIEVEAKRESVAMAVAPPFVTEDRNIIGDLQLKKRGLTTVRNMDKLRELVTGARIDFSIEDIRDLRMLIERAFLMDSLQLKESPAMTATEVQARYDLMMRNISHTLGSLQSNFLDKVITRSVNILYRADELDDIPDSVKNSNSEFDIVYTGPMPRAQRNDDITATMNWVQGVLPALAGMQKEAGEPLTVLDNANLDEIARDLAAMSGVPTKYVNSENDRDELRATRQQAMAQQRKLQEAEQAGKAMQSMGAGSQAVNDTPGAAEALQQVAG